MTMYLEDSLVLSCFESRLFLVCLVLAAFLLLHTFPFSNRRDSRRIISKNVPLGGQYISEFFFTKTIRESFINIAFDS